LVAERQERTKDPDNVPFARRASPKDAADESTDIPGEQQQCDGLIFT
jgi:hypothetical protein